MNPILQARDLNVSFRSTADRGLRVRGRTIRAVDGLDFSIERGESVGVVGESGCGKSTLARVLAGIVAPTSGTVLIDGVAVGVHRAPPLQRRVQMVFQDPSASLNPRLTVGSMLGELIRVRGGSNVASRVDELLALVELPPRIARVRPSRLSGGQRQRVGIARALAVEPDVLIADEAVSALDNSVQAAILNLLSGLQAELHLTVLFISHDLAAVRRVCDRIVVMYLGRIVEDASAEDLFAGPAHPYTEALLAARPSFDHGRRPGEAALPGAPPSQIDIPPGCSFHTRCAYATERCHVEQPVTVHIGARAVACHHPRQTKAELGGAC